MLVLGGVNMFLISFDHNDDVHIPNVYFEVLSVILSVFPVVWTNILDKVKDYRDDLTPPPSTRSSVHSLELDSVPRPPTPIPEA